MIGPFHKPVECILYLNFLSGVSNFGCEQPARPATNTPTPSPAPPPTPPRSSHSATWARWFLLIFTSYNIFLVCLVLPVAVLIFPTHHIKCKQSSSIFSSRWKFLFLQHLPPKWLLSLLKTDSRWLTAQARVLLDQYKMHCDTQVKGSIRLVDLLMVAPKSG